MTDYCSQCPHCQAQRAIPPKLGHALERLALQYPGFVHVSAFRTAAGQIDRLTFNGKSMIGNTSAVQVAEMLDAMSTPGRRPAA